MAIDTANRRASAGAVGPIPLAFPHPDATVDAGDRAQMAAEYRAFFEPAPPPSGSGWLQPMRVSRGF